MSNGFSLRKLEMAMPYMDGLTKNDPKALIALAGIALADEQSLKLVAAGNQEALKVFTDKAYDMDVEEVAALLSLFTRGSQRFTLIMSGLKPEEVNQVVAQQDQKLRSSLDLQ